MKERSTFPVALDVIVEASGHGDPASLWSAFEAMLAPLGLCSVHYESGMPCGGQAEPCLKSDLPGGPKFGDLVNREFMDAVRHEPDLYAADEFVRHCEASVMPMIFETDVSGEMSEPLQNVNDLARDFAVTGGIIVPLRGFSDQTFGNVTYILDLHTPKRPSAMPVAELTALAHTIHGILNHIDDRTAPLEVEQVYLSPQETTCLSWVAAGLSTKRLAHRMGISDATANEYIRNACRKLRAMTRAEATAKAVALGIVRL